MRGGNALPRSSARRSPAIDFPFSPLTRSLYERKSGDHSNGYNRGDRDEMPVERDVADVDVMLRGHLSRKTPGQGVKLHDHPEHHVQSRPDHQDPDCCWIDIELWIQSSKPWASQ